MDFIVYSHLRWNFVYQRPQHLISRFAKQNRVWFLEEPTFAAESASLEISSPEPHLTVCRPALPDGLSEDQAIAMQRTLLDEMIISNRVREFTAWYYTPMAINFSSHLVPAAIVYDCMDELSAFRGAPTGLRRAEAELFRRADLVFTGGQRLYEHKKRQHRSVHAFPSSIDPTHFQRARTIRQEPEDQRAIPHPRLGFAGVIDERFDAGLLDEVAAAKPEWHFVILGPVVKIQAHELPQRPNIHYLGAREYRELPAYMSGWDVGLLPFARNESTRFISPTKTPEYLAAGLPVVSTYIRDVAHPYAQKRLVRIANTAKGFASACQRALASKKDPCRIHKTDAFLSKNSWDITWSRMNTLLTRAVASKAEARSPIVKKPSSRSVLTVSSQAVQGDYV